MGERPTIGQGAWSGGLFAVGATVLLAVLGAIDPTGTADGFLTTVVVVSAVCAPWALVVGSLCGCAVAGIASGCPQLRRFLPVGIAVTTFVVCAPALRLGLPVAAVIATTAGLHAELCYRLRRVPAGGPA